MTPQIVIEPLPSRTPIEMVERKGIGHPDTVCDEIADAISLALCRYYLQEFGAVMHHNVDKALLVGGQSEPAFGGGAITAPIELMVAGRATRQVGDRKIPVDDIAIEAARDWLRRHFRFLDVERDVRITPYIRPGSSELVELFTRIGQGETPLANDTSFGMAFYPLSPTERDVLAMETLLNSSATKTRYPFIGEDIKVMGVATGTQRHFTVAIAMVDRFIDNVADYQNKILEVRDFLFRELSIADAIIYLNTADDYAQGSLYLTVTGTSAESGDDGQVGRGNRANGLITPYRPMSLEALGGKNPVSHIGKIYNLFALDLARALVEENLVAAVEVYIVSQIGHPIDRPQLLHLRTEGQYATAAQVEAFAREFLTHLPGFWRSVIE